MEGLTADRLDNWSVGLSADRLECWSVGLTADRTDGWSVGLLADRSDGWLVGLLVAFHLANLANLRPRSSDEVSLSSANGGLSGLVMPCFALFCEMEGKT